MRLMSYQYSTLPESAGAVNSGKGKTKNRVEQKKGDNKWKAEGGGKGSEDVEHSRKSLPFPPAFMILIVLLFSRNARGKTGVIGVAVRKFSESLAVEFFSDVFDAFVQLFGNLFPSHPVYVLVEEES